MTQTTATVRETAAAMRKALRAAFPGTSFSVRMSRGTGHGWLDVTWTDGPTVEQVTSVTSRFQSKRFDGMDDGYHSTGVARWSCCGVITNRRDSDERLAYARSILTRDSDGWLVAADRHASVRAPWQHADEDMVARMWCQAVPA